MNPDGSPPGSRSGLALLVLLLALLPALAGAAPSRRAARQAVSREPASSEAPYGASLAFHLGLGGSFDRDGHRSAASPTLGVTPIVERRYGTSFALGAEWMFLWVRQQEQELDRRRKLWAPHLRARLSFPVWQQLEVGALLAVGVGLYFADKEEGGFALAFPSYRFAFGGSYPLDTQVSLFADLGYYSADYTGETERGEQSSQFGTVLFSTGLMADF